jgi:uncharacterized membrane protein
MTESRFSKGAAVKFGWETTTGNIGLLVFGWIIFIAIGMMPAVATDSMVVAVVAWVFDLVVWMGLMRMTLKFVDGSKGELADLFSTFHLILRYLIASIAVGIIVVIGLILFVIPGIYWGIRFYMFGWVIVDKDVGPFEAMRLSWEMTRGSCWNLFLFSLLLGGINILGMLALFIGLLITVPLSVIAIGYVYRRLEEAM